MYIWAYREDWNAPRVITDSEDSVAKFAQLEENEEYILFFARLVTD